MEFSERRRSTKDKKPEKEKEGDSPRDTSLVYRMDYRYLLSFPVTWEWVSFKEKIVCDGLVLDGLPSLG